MQKASKNGNRRGFFVGALLFASAYGGLRWLNKRPGPIEYETLTGIPGFRRVAGGEISTVTSYLFIGLGVAEDPPIRVPLSRLCDELFFEGTGPGVPVAFFTDYFCPYCRVLTKSLADRVANGKIVLTTHETPLLSAESEIAARAALAARRQDAYHAFHQRLMRSVFSPEAPYLTKLANNAGIDAERLLREMNSAVVTERLELTRSVAARFGFFATPSVVIGRTVIVGSISEELLDKLIEAEAVDPGDAC